MNRLIDEYITWARQHGHITSDATEDTYRRVLMYHAREVADPCRATVADVRATLAFWPNPSTYRTRRSMLVSFYDWLMMEDHIPFNPARLSPPPARTNPTQSARMTTDDVRAFLDAVTTDRERRCAYIGVFAGLRRKELLGLQGRHFRRENWLHVSPDIGKGGRERWIPVLSDVEGVVNEVRRNVEANEFVLPSLRYQRQGQHALYVEYPHDPSSPQAIHRIVKTLGERAGLPYPAHPHLMRYAFTDHVARHADVHVAQALLGHANIATTDRYLSAPTLDDLSQAVAGVALN